VTGPSYDVLASQEVYAGRVISLRRDTVRMPEGGSAVREVVAHLGAVGVVAPDEQGRVLLLRQYRHPVGAYLLELPAGLLDIEDEPASTAAARELAEEAGLTAGRWDVLVDAHASPGMSDEAYRVFLARDLGVLAVRPALEHEELDLSAVWLPLEEAVERVLAGGITNAMAVIGVLSAARAVGQGMAGLRGTGAPWPARPTHLG